jgi:Tol biopolymer transport system component
MSTGLVGQRLGPYEIVSWLGSGGMGDVYRARDTALGRDVAIKILPDLFALDAERRARFEREARLLASLNHPRIGAIYGFEQRDGAYGLVLELVEGETLAQHLRAGPVPVREALAIARQIAEALEAAHEKGIIHRDLKPANVVLSQDGAIKVLDFGLAKARLDESSQDLSHSPTITAGGTRAGVLLGTAAYMSPEQARGKVVDKRTDIWAFGCVLYELLTGSKAFAGDTVSDTLASILERAPDWSALPSTTPPTVRRLLQRCLEKDRKLRLHDIADARIEIDDALERPAEVAGGVPRRKRVLRIVLWMVPALFGAALIAGFAIRAVTPARPAAVTRFAISPPDSVELGFGMALSPDGRTLVYSGVHTTGRRLYRRTLDALESVPIRGTDGATLPFFSPDGATVGFVVDRTIRRVPLQGGTATTVSEAGAGGGSPTWLADDTIVFGTEGRGLMRVPAAGGELRRLTTLDAERGELEHRWPVVLPRGRAIAFTIHYGGQDSQRTHAVSLDSGERVQLVQGNGARFLSSGHIVFQRGGSLWIAPFDERALKLTAPPTAAVEGVGIALDWSPKIAVATSGSLAFATGGEPYPPRTLVWVDRLGREQTIDAPGRSWYWPQISPDGRRIGLHIMDPVNMDAWIYELDHGPLIRMTYHAHQDGFPLWSPDGKHVVFWSRQGGGPGDLYRRSADLSGSEVRLTTSREFTYMTPFAWADGGKLLVFQEDSRGDTGLDIGVIPIEGTHTPRLVIKGPSDEGRPAMSPNGRWIAYQSNLSGRWEVYVQPFPDLNGRWQVSTQGGLAPLWGPNGRELFYRNGNAVMSVGVETAGNTFRYSTPVVLFEGSYVPERTGAGDARSYDLAPDGKRFLMMKEPAPPPTQIVVISNWVEEVKRLVPIAR